MIIFQPRTCMYNSNCSGLRPQTIIIRYKSEIIYHIYIYIYRIHKYAHGNIKKYYKRIDDKRPVKIQSGITCAKRVIVVVKSM